MKLPKQVKYRETNAKPDSKSDKRIFALMLQLCSRRTLTFFFYVSAHSKFRSFEIE